jgi:hypothetical protein
MGRARILGNMNKPSEKMFSRKNTNPHSFLPLLQDQFKTMYQITFMKYIEISGILKEFLCMKIRSHSKFINLR